MSISSNMDIHIMIYDTNLQIVFFLFFFKWFCQNTHVDVIISFGLVKKTMPILHCSFIITHFLIHQPRPDRRHPHSSMAWIPARLKLDNGAMTTTPNIKLTKTAIYHFVNGIINSQIYSIHHEYKQLHWNII